MLYCQISGSESALALWLGPSLPRFSSRRSRLIAMYLLFFLSMKEQVINSLRPVGKWNPACTKISEIFVHTTIVSCMKRFVRDGLSELRAFFNLLDDVDLYLAVVHVQEAAHQERPLEDEGGNQHVQAHGAIAVTLQERHQETEANEDHHVDILEH